MMNTIAYGTFNNQWLVPSLEPVNNLVWQISDQAIDYILNNEYTVAGFMTQQRLAVQRLSSTFGSNPYVALSGGIDSQATCLLLLKSGVEFTAAIMVFPDGMNAHDVDSAISFCEHYAIPHVLVDFNILTFLGRDLSSYVAKYDCPSPQLTAHCCFYEILIAQYAPSSIICGGNPPCIREGKWEFISNRSHSVWMKFAHDNKYPLIGNFLGYSVEIALPFMIMQPDMSLDPVQRYQAKITGMHKLGLRVRPQEQKFTGFENVKAYYGRMSGDGWTFEKWFRLPHHNKRPEYDSVLQLSNDVSSFLSEKHRLFN